MLGKIFHSDSLNAKQKKKLDDLLDSYDKIVRPLMKLLVKINGTETVNCLNEIRAMNDHLARCFRDGNEERQIDIELHKAEGHLERLVLDCFKQLIIFIKEDIQQIEKTYFSRLWFYWGEKENFWQYYCSLKESGLNAEIEAKKIETLDKKLSMEQYELALNCFIDMVSSVKKYDLKKSRLYKIYQYVNKSSFKIISSIIVSVISYCICYLIDK